MTILLMMLCDNLECWNIVYINKWQLKHKHHFCDRKCRDKWQSIKMAGIENPMKRHEVSIKLTGENNVMKRKDVAEKVSASLKGDNHHMKKPENALKVTGERNGMYGRKGESSPSFGKKRSAETKQLMSISKKGKYTGENNPMFGKEHTPETRQKMSDNHADFSGKNSPLYGKPGLAGERNGMYGKPPPKGSGNGKGSYFTKEDGKIIWLRSTYETRIAILLTKFGIKWEYEPRRFIIDTTTYSPDFYLPEYNIWWEIKGYMRDSAKIKITLFFIQYPLEILRILYNDDINKLEQLSRLTEIDIMTIGTGEI